MRSRYLGLSPGIVYCSGMTAANRPVTEMPLNTFFESGRDFFFNGEAVFLYHAPSHSDGNIFVHFRGSDVLVAGGGMSGVCAAIAAAPASKGSEISGSKAMPRFIRYCPSLSRSAGTWT